jgi:hypothetical protein
MNPKAAIANHEDQKPRKPRTINHRDTEAQRKSKARKPVFRFAISTFNKTINHRDTEAQRKSKARKPVSRFAISTKPSTTETQRHRESQRRENRRELRVIALFSPNFWLAQFPSFGGVAAEGGRGGCILLPRKGIRSPLSSLEVVAITMTVEIFAHPFPFGGGALNHPVRLRRPPSKGGEFMVRLPWGYPSSPLLFSVSLCLMVLFVWPVVKWHHPAGEVVN